jgi:hypothetical protein
MASVPDMEVIDDWKSKDDYWKSHIWRHNNKELASQKEKERHHRIKIEVITHYSPELKCIKCGYSDIRALTIDHINGGGQRHREQLSFNHFYSWLKSQNYPEGYQVLCMNCQFVKRVENNEFRKRSK